MSFLVIISLNVNCLANGSWNQASIYSSGATDVPFGFSIGTKGYVGGGRTSTTIFKSDFWEFDPVTNVWMQKASYPGGEKCSQASFVINDKAYVGLGFDLAYHDEFYEYDPLTNIWIQKATFPGGERYSSTWFTIGNSGYIVGGWDGGALDDCWEYTPATDTWVQKANFPGGNRQGGIGFAINNLGYACTGYNQPTHYNDLWQFDPVNNTWTSKSPFPGTPRRGCSAFVLNDEAYVGLGFDVNYKTDFYKYNPTSDSWSQEADFGGIERYHTFYFAINNKGYVGLGSNGTPQVPLFTDDVWVFEPAGDFNLIQGNLFADFNNDNIQDSIEPSLTNKKLIETTTGNIAFTNQNGFYSLAVDDTGDYEIMALDMVTNFSVTPSNYSVNFSSMLQIDSLNDFAFQAAGILNDLCLTITPTGNFRSGMNGMYVLSYSNFGNTTLNGTVVFYPDTNVSYSTSSLTPISVTSDSIVFSVGNISPFQTGQFTITVGVDLGLTIGTLINSSALILPIIGDANPTCNTAFFEILVTGSFDPNDILVNRSFIYDYQVPNQPELEYLIRFQNTGNDTAFTVRVMNPIDTMGLILNTLEFVASSHPATINWMPLENSMRFLFENILLADSNVNEPMSHGFIRYKIKPKTNLVVGDSITSQAFIFFDFNSAVVTNIARTDIITPTGIYDQGNNDAFISVYPNPVHSFLTIQVNRAEQKNITLELYNVYGQKIRAIECNEISGDNFKKTIDVSDFSSGIYFIKAADSYTVKKFVRY